MKINIILISVITLIGFWSCSSSKSITSTNSSDIELNDGQKQDFTYNLFEAEKQYLEERYDLAEGYYLHCLAIDPNSALVNYKLASIYLAKKDEKLAVSYIEKCIAVNDSNKWYLYFAGNIYQKTKQFDKAVIIYKKLILLDQQEIDFFLSLADVYLEQNDPKAALKVYDEIEVKFGVQESISIQKNKIYLSLGKPDKAADELIKLAVFFNNDSYYFRLLAEFYIQIGQISKASDIYSQMLISNTNDGYAHLGLAECYRLSNNYEKAFKELLSAFKCNDVESEIKVNIIVNLLQNIGNNKELFNQVLELTETLVQLYPENPDVNTIYADFQLKMGNIDIARSALLKVVDIRKDKYAIWEQLLMIDNEFKDWISLYKHSKEALEYFPNQTLVYFFNGFSAFQLEYDQEAKKSLEIGYQILAKDDVLRNDFLTFLGEVNYKLGFKKEAYAYFDKLLAAGNDNIGVLNNYSYYLSLDKENMDKAEEMSLKTIKKEPENPTYLDTYAWILFVKGDYVRALEYIAKAVMYNNNVSGVIVEHYGDILFFNHKVDEAVIQWQNAQKIGNGSEKLNEKIESKKYIE